MRFRLAYLSGAPRVSTSETASLGAARTHVLGVVEAFERRGWTVDRFIAGDHLDPAMVGRSDSFVKASSPLRRVAGDLGKIVFGRLNRRRVARELPQRPHWAYERFAAFQSLGEVYRRRGVPWILETQGPMFYEAAVERRVAALTPISKAMELAAYRRCDVLVCVSEASRELFSNEHRIQRDKIVVVPNGVDVRFFDPARAHPERHFPFFTVGFVGSLDPWQAVDRLIDATAALVHRKGADLGLVIAGDGILRDELENLAASLSISNRVKFVGRYPRSALPGLIRGFDLGYSGQRVMHIGSMYHSPLKLLEYMVMEVPPLASMFSDSRTLVRDGRTGFLFSHDRPGDLADTLHSVMSRRSELSQMGRVARADVLREHSWDARVDFMIREINARLPSSHRVEHG